MIYPSCGHAVQCFDECTQVVIRGTDREFNKVLSSEVVCWNCYRSYRRDGIVFDSEQEALEWLTR